MRLYYTADQLSCGLPVYCLKKGQVQTHQSKYNTEPEIINETDLRYSSSEQQVELVWGR